MKYLICSYGCQMNTADSEEMAQPLERRGFVATSKLAEADIVLMNTCTVRDQAEHRADSNIGRLRAWKGKNPNRILIVAGCAASRWGDSIQRKYPFIDLVSPATQIEQFPDAIAHLRTAEALDPTLTQMHLALAYFAVHAKRWDDARHQYEEAIRLGVTDPAILKDYKALPPTSSSSKGK